MAMSKGVQRFGEKTRRYSQRTASFTMHIMTPYSMAATLNHWTKSQTNGVSESKDIG